MEFNKVISELQYYIKEKTDKFIIIKFDDKPSSISIIFGLEDKVISASLIPNSQIHDLNDMTHQYALFNKMERDVKKLSEMSNFRRV